jgi:OmpA-OmpF porin, OOP family
MKANKFKYLIRTLLCIAGFAAATAHAQFYLGASAGQSKAGLNGGDIASQLLDLGFSSPSVSLSDKTTSYGLKLGYQFGPYVGVEGNYTDLGKYSYQANVSPAGSLNTELKVKGYGLELVGTLPVFDKFSLLGRAGVQRMKTDGVFSATGSIDLATTGASQTSTAGKIGFGVQYDLSQNLGLRLEVERFRKLGGNALGSAFDTDNYSIGILFKF